MADIHTHYDNLKVARNAPASVIKAAYKALCQSYHPDKFQGSNAEAERIMKLINTSYEVLIDPVKRAKHDRWIDDQQLKDALFSETEEEQYSQRWNTQQENNQPSQPSPESKQSKSSTPIYSWLRWVVFVVCCFVLLLVYAGWKSYDHTHGGSGVSGFLRGVIIFVPLTALWRWAKSGNKPKTSSDPQQYPHEPPSGFPSGKGWLLWIGAIIIVIWLYSESDDQNTVPSQASNLGSPAAINSSPMQATPSSINNPPQYIVDGATSRTTSTQEPKQQAQAIKPSSTNSAEDISLRANDLYIQKHYAEALPLYQYLAQQGDADAQTKLAMMYQWGRGLALDYNQAIYWYNKAAEQGDSWAQTMLAELYAHGHQGVTPDYNQALFWYIKAAKQGNATAQRDLGYIYLTGRGVALDYIQALYWYRKSAEQADETAQYNLGVMYANGQGVARNYTQAIYWFRKAEEQGNTDAIAALNKLGIK